MDGNEATIAWIEMRGLVLSVYNSIDLARVGFKYIQKYLSNLKRTAGE